MELRYSLGHEVWKNGRMKNGGMTVPVFGMGPEPEGSVLVRGLEMFPCVPNSPDSCTTNREKKQNFKMSLKIPSRAY